MYGYGLSICIKTAVSDLHVRRGLQPRVPDSHHYTQPSGEIGCIVILGSTMMIYIPQDIIISAMMMIALHLRWK